MSDTLLQLKMNILASGRQRSNLNPVLKKESDKLRINRLTLTQSGSEGSFLSGLKELGIEEAGLI